MPFPNQEQYIHPCMSPVPLAHTFAHLPYCRFFVIKLTFSYLYLSILFNLDASPNPTISGMQFQGVQSHLG